MICQGFVDQLNAIVRYCILRLPLKESDKIIEECQEEDKKDDTPGLQVF